MTRRRRPTLGEALGRHRLGVALFLLACALAWVFRVRPEPDPKWELAIRKGMPFVSATPLDDAPPPPSEGLRTAIRQAVDHLFIRAFLEPSEEEYLVLTGKGGQSWLLTRELDADWRAFYLDVAPVSDVVVRCYPRFRGMSWFEGDFFAESGTLPKGRWSRLRIDVRLFRQLARAELQDLRIDVVSPGGSPALRLGAIYIERER